MAQVVELKSSSSPSQKLNNYYTVNLTREKRGHDFSRACWLLLGAATVVVAVATVFFLFSFTVDAVIYIPYLAIATILFIDKANIKNKYNLHRDQSAFIQKILETIPHVDLGSLPWHDRTTEAQRRQIMARYMVAQEVVNDRLAAFGQTLIALQTDNSDAKPIIVDRFFSTKKEVLEGLKELSWIEHLIQHPFESMNPKDYVPNSFKNPTLYQQIAQSAITVA
jgi:hypothetical protein